MIIQSIRLKNIKTYGEGPDGNGVMVPFQAGVNRIAGSNGHGKTTLIECLGYALFLAEPVFEENFKTETYFLKHGAKAGEIDVTFSFKDDTYRIERGVGVQSKRRSKVIQLGDGSICAEGDQEVADFLCRLLDIPSPDRLAEMFSKLIGVKQGRLAWPFDSKSGDAKKFFEPLLEVEVFRQCFDRLKPAVEYFAEDRIQHQTKEAAVNERIRERADSQERLATTRQAVFDQTTAVENTAKARDVALQQKQKQEGFEKAVIEAKSARDQADAVALNAKEKRLEAERRVRESEQAAQTVAQSKQGHEAYEDAEKALQELEAKRAARDVLRTKREKAESDRKDREGNARAVREQQKFLAGQQDKKSAQHKDIAAAIGPIRADLESGQKAFERTQQAAEVAATDQEIVKAWVQGLPRLVKRLKSAADGIAILGTELSAWDPARISAARNVEKAASEALSEAKDLLAQARERKATLAEQLKQIGGGVCPFLKETCRQFDPAKIQSDLATLDSEAARLEARSKEARKAHEAAQKALTPLVTAENQLVSKREQLTRDIADYGEEFSAMAPAEPMEAARRLRAWHEGIEPSPKGLALPKEDLMAGHVSKLQQAAETLAAEVASWWAETGPRISERLTVADNAKTERAKKETDLENLAGQLAGLEKEAVQLGQAAAVKEKDAGRYDAEAAVFKTAVEELDEQLKPSASLDGEIDAQKTIREANKPGHERYLKFKALADDLGLRRENLKQGQASEQAAANALSLMESALKLAQESFDRDQLKLAREEYDQKLVEATAAAAHLVHANSELGRQETRFKEWKTACQERDEIEKEIARCHAAVELTEIARKTLRDAAPAVAQHLCHRIAVRAQVVFNQINPDPLELEWKAENYSLRITPGDRRFAMLSGGEQTKLALAMTLAMVEEFSGLRFCVFDEPTYGVDVDSRRKLADAVLEAQQAAALEQLLLVSHDDAFEGKIEHSILLQKSAAHGTSVAVTQ